MSKIDIPPPRVPTQLIVFADDWGRHPSSSQHLIRELLPQYPTLWVNTVGTRRPRLSLNDIKRAFDISARWVAPRRQHTPQECPPGLRVIAPRMYPGYRTGWQRRLNARQVRDAVERGLQPGYRHIAITTLPTTADLPDMPGIDRWVYYCVDDYSAWPGADHAVMDAMERELLNKVDAVAAVSSVLIDRLGTLGADARLIDHGVSLEHWTTPDPASPITHHWPDESRPIALFWGLLDSRLETSWVSALTASACHAVLAGPHSAPLDGVLMISGGVFTGPLPHKDLPAHAAASDVLIMPYIDAPVTRAMQPLKLKEYLATMKPVVVRDLPATREWADCCDLATSAGGFVDLVKRRAETGILPEQLEARKRRLPGESWTNKAAQLAEIISAG